MNNDVSDFDVLLFGGADVGGVSNCSRVAMVLVRPTRIQESLTETYVLECGEEALPDADSGQKRCGVQLQYWPYIRLAHTGRIWRRRLTMTDAVRRDAHQRLADAWKNSRTASYGNLHFGDLLRAEFGVEMAGKENAASFACSSYMAYVFCKLALVNPTFSWEMFCPRDFAVNGRMDEALKSLKRASLGPLEQIK